MNESSFSEWVSIEASIQTPSRSEHAASPLQLTLCKYITEHFIHHTYLSLRTTTQIAVNIGRTSYIVQFTEPYVYTRSTRDVLAGVPIF